MTELTTTRPDAIPADVWATLPTTLKQVVGREGSISFVVDALDDGFALSEAVETELRKIAASTRDLRGRVIADVAANPDSSNTQQHAINLAALEMQGTLLFQSLQTFIASARAFRSALDELQRE